MLTEANHVSGNGDGKLVLKVPPLKRVAVELGEVDTERCCFTRRFRWCSGEIGRRKAGFPVSGPFHLLVDGGDALLKWLEEGRDLLVILIRR